MSASNKDSLLKKSEKESSSPFSKKIKLSDTASTNTQHARPAGDAVDREEAMETQKAEPPAKRALNLPPSQPQADLSAATPGPPQWFLSFFQDFERRLDTRIQSLLDDKLGDLKEKVREHEDKLENVDFEIKHLQDTMKNLKKENNELINKLDDLENRSRRKNLVIFGIPEAVVDEKRSTKEDCAKTIRDFFQFVGAVADDVDKIERCHRTPTHPMHTKDQDKSQPPPPRRIHVGFSTYCAKERVRKACIEKLKSTRSLYNEKKIFVAEDLSKRVLVLRKKKSSEFQRLKEEGKRPFFAYPDRLCYRDHTGKVISV